MADLPHPAGGDEGVLERLRRADVARPGGGREDEDAIEPGARSRNPVGIGHGCQNRPSMALDRSRPIRQTAPEAIQSRTCAS